jgi:hypothetical protein
MGGVRAAHHGGGDRRDMRLGSITAGARRDGAMEARGTGTTMRMTV